MDRSKINKIKNNVHKACKSPKNHAGYSAWTHHIVPAVAIGVELARKMGADEEIVELSIWLHDLGSVSCGEARQDEHHITGRNLAETMLRKYGYSEEKVEKVKHCIYAHRATQAIPRETLEAEIVASADAMSHFYYLDDIFYLAFVVRRLETDEARAFVLKKLSNSYKKLLPEAREMVDAKYEEIKKALNPGF